MFWGYTCYPGIFKLFSNKGGNIINISSGASKMPLPEAGIPLSYVTSYLKIKQSSLIPNFILTTTTVVLATSVF
jgi:hypothetical protein